MITASSNHRNRSILGSFQNAENFREHVKNIKLLVGVESLAGPVSLLPDWAGSRQSWFPCFPIVGLIAS